MSPRIDRQASVRNQIISSIFIHIEKTWYSIKKNYILLDFIGGIVS
jgi:hypothetical protein